MGNTIKNGLFYFDWFCFSIDREISCKIKSIYNIVTQPCMQHTFNGFCLCEFVLRKEIQDSNCSLYTL